MGTEKRQGFKKNGMDMRTRTGSASYRVRVRDREEVPVLET